MFIILIVFYRYSVAEDDETMSIDSDSRSSEIVNRNDRRRINNVNRNETRELNDRDIDSNVNGIGNGIENAR